MQKFDISILKKNISTLMQNKNMTQAQLAEHLGMSQPNISKALNHADPKCFTVEQVFSLAALFEVSIDELVGFEKPISKSSSKRFIGEFIIRAIDGKDATFADAEYVDSVAVKEWDDLDDHYVHYFRDIKNTYTALLFPNYWTPSTDADRDFAYTYGNKGDNQHVNSFIQKYMAVLAARAKGGFPDDAYRIVLDKYLDDLEKQTTEIPF